MIAQIAGHLALVADIDLACGIVAHENGRKTGHEIVLALQPRGFRDHALPELRRKRLAVDDFSRHLHRPIAASFSAIVFASPSTSISLRRAVSPPAIVIADFGRPSVSARSATSALLALPASGAAATRILSSFAPSALSIQPSMASRPPLGVRRIASRIGLTDDIRGDIRNGPLDQELDDKPDDQRRQIETADRRNDPPDLPEDRL